VLPLCNLFCVGVIIVVVKTALIELERLLKCNIVVLVAYLYCIQSFLLFALYIRHFFIILFFYIIVHVVKQLDASKVYSKNNCATTDKTLL